VQDRESQFEEANGDIKHVLLRDHFFAIVHGSHEEAMDYFGQPRRLHWQQ